MKIYVSVDMEGISGIMLREQLFPGERMYDEARILLTNEVNVVVESLLCAGATDIIVKDAHGSGYNLIAGQLHPGATYFSGASGMNNRFPGLDATFAGAMLIGYHAMAGTKNAVCDHTMTSTGWQSICLNGAEVGEIALDALIFGTHGVPVLFVSGDDATCLEAERTLPWVATYSTKTGIGRHAALYKAPQKVHAELPLSIAQAVGRRADCRPYTLPGPFEATIRFMNTAQADVRSFDGVASVRVDGLTVKYQDEEFIRLLSHAM